MQQKFSSWNVKTCFIFSAYPPFMLNAFDTTGPSPPLSTFLRDC